MFVFVIWDSEEKKIFLARDRLGIKPLYYYFKDGEFVFGSEIKSILQFKKIKREVNTRALSHFMSLRYVPGPDTMFQDIWKLQPGCYMVFKNGKKNIKKYWKLKMNPSNKSIDFYSKKIEQLLSESVKKRLISEVPFGAYLSGGIDSSSVVGLMSQNSEEPIKTFSVGFGEERVDELKYAKIIADYFGTDHHEIIVKQNYADLLPKMVWHFDEPTADPAAIPTYLLSKKAKKYVTVVLTGEGGDELFAGYEQHKWIYNTKKYFGYLPGSIMSLGSEIMRIVPMNIYDHFFKFTSSFGPKAIDRGIDFFGSINKDVLESYLSIVSIFDKEEHKNIFQKNKNTIKQKYSNYFKNIKNENVINKMLLLETEIQLPDNFLMKTDRTTMAGSIEARVPLLDHKIVEFASTIPQNFKLNNLKSKFIFKKSMSEIIPKSIIERKKHRFFVPIDTWLEKGLKDIVINLFEEDEVKRLGFFDYNYLKKIFENFENSKFYYSRQIWNLLNFELWRRTFIERDKIEKPLRSI